MDRMEKLHSTLDGLAAQVQENVTKAVMVLMEAKFGARFAELEAKLANMTNYEGEDFIGPPAKKRNMGA
eukprot:13361089-Heterocapsa_arctica.AAC.1